MGKTIALRFEIVRFLKKPALYALKTLNFKLTLPSLDEHAKKLIFLLLVYSFLWCRKQRNRCSRRGSFPSGRAGGIRARQDAHLPLLSLFLPIVKEAEEQLQQKGFLSFWSSRRYEHAKMLIFLLLVYSFLWCRKQRSSCSRRGSSPSGRADGTSTLRCSSSSC